jgi:hypothetical protein
MMLKRLKAAAASVWGFIKSLATDSIRQLEDELEHEIVRLGGELDQSRRACVYLEKAYEERGNELASKNNTIRRQVEEIAGLKFLASKSEANKEAVRVLTEERDGFMRESAARQGRYKDFSEVMGAMKHLIEVKIDGKEPEQHWARVLASTLAIPIPPTGDTSATDESGGTPVARETFTVTHGMSGDGNPPIVCPTCDRAVWSYTTNNITGKSWCDQCGEGA